jgi:L-ornithine Nalpha-acyltransferase
MTETTSKTKVPAAALSAMGAAPRGADTELARSETVEVRLATNPAEIEAALRLRYDVFYREHGAKPSAEMAAREQDFDRFDDVADHLLVVDSSRGVGAAGVVGTYRLMRRPHAAILGTFYTASEYDISRLTTFPKEVLELGRSCVHSDYRNRATMQLLWKGIASYVFRYKIGLMFGCASMPGTDVDAVATQLSYLHHAHLAPEDLRARALPDLYVEMNRIPAEQIDGKRVIASLPPLIKGYLRLGGFVGEGAVVDPQFNTTDVCVIVKTDAITEKYFKHYERAAQDEDHS